MGEIAINETSNDDRPVWAIDDGLWSCARRTGLVVEIQWDRLDLQVDYRRNTFGGADSTIRSISRTRFCFGEIDKFSKIWLLTRGPVLFGR